VIKPIRKTKNSIYHDSFYRYKKRPSPIRWFIFLICIIALTILCLRASYASQFSGDDFLTDIGSGHLLFSSANKDRSIQSNDVHAAILLSSAASFEVNGLIASVTLTQSFINQSDNTVNGIYAFPLPENSAVNHLHIQVADRIIEGKIMEKAQAQKIFVQAKKSGKKASLVQQYRPNLFTNHIANIAAHEQVTVTIKYFQHIDYIDGKFSLRFPMKITPRYQAKSLTNDSFLAPQSTNPLDKENNGIVANNFVNKNSQPSNKIQLDIKLNAGIELSNITSPSHTLTIINAQSKNPEYKPFLKEKTFTIDVGNVQVAMDRDFILTWQPSPSNEPRLSVFKQELNGELYSLAMLLPPTQENSDNRHYSVKDEQQLFTRDITFIIDTSGSMQGQSIIQAKQSLLFALQTLSVEDSFNIIAFESRFHQLFSNTVMASPQNITLATTFIENLDADGGTEMYKPLAAALEMPTTSVQKSSAIKQVIFITDGAVSNELALFKLIHDTPQIPRLFTVGIGSAPNGYFMRKAAQFGRGSYTYIGKVNEIKTKMSALLEKISRPALRNIAVQFQPLHLGSIEQYPKKIPDLYYGEPLIVAFKTSIMPDSMQLFGEQANKGWHQENSLIEQQNSIGITPIWARAKIEDLLDGLVTGKSKEQVKKQVLTTSLLHQVISPYSSFIAVEQEKQEKPLEGTNTDKQATAFPKTATGWQAPFFTGVLLLISSLIMQARRTILFGKRTACNKKC